ncbi:Superoxide dismutase [Mn] [Candidatus Hepatincola sp. Pdp]
MTFTLEKLPFSMDSLAPFMSAETLEFHYGKHHQTYVDNLNNLIKDNEYKDLSLEEIINKSYKEKNNPIFNNAAQNYNHIEFWNSMKKGAASSMPDKLKDLIIKNFTSVEKFKEDLLKAGTTLFGSGWVWLALDNDKLEIMQCSNAANPLVFNKKPILGCDVWEHSYYIDYRNKRADFLKAWYENLINWEYVATKLG